MVPYLKVGMIYIETSSEDEDEDNNDVFGAIYIGSSEDENEDGIDAVNDEWFIMSDLGWKVDVYTLVQFGTCVKLRCITWK